MVENKSYIMKKKGLILVIYWYFKNAPVYWFLSNILWYIQDTNNYLNIINNMHKQNI